MIILVKALAATSGGALTILKNFIDEISKDNLRNQYVIITSSEISTDHQFISIKKVSKYKTLFGRLFFDFFMGNYYVKKYKPNLILSFDNTIFFGLLKVKQISYIHQPITFTKNFNPNIFFDTKLFIYKHLISILIKLSVFLSYMVIVQTKWMKEAIVVSKLKKTESVFISSLKKFNFDIEPKKYNRNYFFYPTSNLSYKNNSRLLNVFNHLVIKHPNIRLYITLDRPNNNIFSNNIKFLGRISRSEVIDILSQSTLIFPSLLESLGLPIIEAMSLGRPVLAANLDYAKEITQDYKGFVYLFNPYLESSIEEAIIKIITSNTEELISNSIKPIEIISNDSLSINDIINLC